MCSLIDFPVFFESCVGGASRYPWKNLGGDLNEGRVLGKSFGIHNMLEFYRWHRTPPSMDFEKVLDET